MAFTRWCGVRLLFLFLLPVVPSASALAQAPCKTTLDCAQAAVTAATQAQAQVTILSNKVDGLQARITALEGVTKSLGLKWTTDGGNNGTTSCANFCATNMRAGYCVGAVLTSGPKNGTVVDCGVVGDTFSGTSGGQSHQSCTCIAKAE